MLQRLLLLTISISLCSFSLLGQNWSFKSDRSINTDQSINETIPRSYQIVSTPFSDIKKGLQKTITSQRKSTIMLPLPDGRIEKFIVTNAPVFDEVLRQKYPSIQSFRIRAASGNHMSGRIGYSQKGFHAMITGDDMSTVFIDQLYHDNKDVYICYHREDYEKSVDFHCHVKEDGPTTSQDNHDKSLAGDCQLRSYRLALACTGEYAQYHGGTIESTLAEYNVAISRVNEIYERDLGITFVIIAESEQVIYLDGNTDPYTNNDGGEMLDENQETLDNVIGTENYDIGHVFSTGGGGIASLRSVCNTNRKARGVTGLGNPINDPFYVDYVCHEIGHQFGGNHTQNNNCNRNGSTAVEPGSANTIMGYAGICAPNTQNNSDDHFHAASIAEVADFITNGQGNNCAMFINTNNNAPSVTSAQSSYVLPIATPFVLTAEASDIDGDMLSYCWEQMDTEVATMPPLTTNTGGPAFISRPPTDSPSRYFPALSDIVAGNTPEWEVIPFVSRDMNFRCTVRDNFAGNGCTDETDVQLSFTDEAGPFLVESPNGGESWFLGDDVTITWDVANTDQAPVSCSNVDILLSTDGGLSFDTAIAENVPNNGSHTMETPDIATEQARVMVKCSEGLFLDISNEDFEIIVPYTLILLTNNALTLCNGESDFLGFEINTSENFSGSIDVEVNNIPAGINVTAPTAPITGPDMITISIENINAAPGIYPITVTASVAADGTSTSEIINVIIEPNAPTINLLSPVDGSRDASSNTTLVWEEIIGIRSYEIQVSENPSFTDATFYMTQGQASVTIHNLSEGTVYYWRVRPVGECFSATYSDPFAFQLGFIECTEYVSLDTPIEILETEVASYTSLLTIQNAQEVDYIKAYVGLDHSYMGDVIASLIAPNGVEYRLFDRIGFPESNFGCSEDNIVAEFFDQSPNSAAFLEDSCPPEEDSYQSIDPLAGITDINGQWILKIDDEYNEDGGALNLWYLSGCRALGIDPLNVTTTDLLLERNESIIVAGSGTTISNADDNSTKIIITKMPLHGDLILSNGAGASSTLALGSSFTVADMKADLISYQHNGSIDIFDSYSFDVIDNTDLRWAYSQEQNFTIIQEAFVVGATLTQAISCNDAMDAIIEATVSGGLAPYEYSIDGGLSYQNSNVFENLGTGNYTITIRDDSGMVIQSNELQITAPDPISLEATVEFDDLVIIANGGTAPYQYSLDGTTFNDDGIFLDITGGEYTITIIDANECMYTETFETPIFEILTISESHTDLTCHDDASGQIIGSASGGFPPYLYSLDGVDYTEEHTFDDLDAGNYTLYLLDMNSTELSVTVSILEPDPITFDYDGDFFNGITISNVLGGTPPYMYSFDGGANFNIDSTGLIIAPDVDSWTYELAVMDANGCRDNLEISAFVSNNQEVLDLFDLQILPNPVRDQLYISLGEKSPSRLQLSILDITGKLVFEKNIKSTQSILLTIDMTTFIAGNYLLKVESESQQGLFKLIKL